MSLSFTLIAIIFFCIGIYMLIIGKYTIMSYMLIIAFISYLIGNLKQVRKIVKKINIKGFELEFKNEEQNKFADIAIELLENNFPILSDVGQEEVNKRIASWIKDFVSEIEKQKIPAVDTKLFYDPDFQYVLNKAIETVARRNDKLINKTLIRLLIERLKYSNTSDNVYINQISSVITEDMPKLCEEHFKMLSAIHLFENILQIKPCNDIENFQTVVIPLLKQFIEKDVKCYFDIQNSVLVHCGGNKDLQIVNKIFSNQNNYYSGGIFGNFWDYLASNYTFLVELTKEQKQELLDDEFLKICEKNFNRIYQFTKLTPLGNVVIKNYFIEQLENFDELYTNTNYENIKE